MAGKVVASPYDTTIPEIVKPIDPKENLTRLATCKLAIFYHKVRYQYGEQLGIGTTSTVYLAHDRVEKMDVAIKINRASEYYLARSERERSSLVKVAKVPHAVQLLDVFRVAPFQNALICRVHKGELFHTYTRSKTNKLTLKEIKVIGKGLLIMLSHLSKLQIVIADFKTPNIAFDAKNQELTVFDFGSAFSMDAKQEVLNLALQTTEYRAPEVAFRRTALYGPAMDMWSYGCILYELYKVNLLFQIPYVDKFEVMNRDLIYLIQKHLGQYPPQTWFQKTKYRDSIEKYFSTLPAPTNFKALDFKPWHQKIESASKQRKDPNGSLLIDLLTKIFVYNPRERIAPDEALKHSFFSKDDDEKGQD